MAKTATRKKTAVVAKTIEEAIEAYTTYLDEHSSFMEAENARVVLDMFADYLDGDHDEDDERGEDADTFCARSAPAKVIDGLDRFLRYTVMRELILDYDQRQCIFVTVYEFCDWLAEKGLLPAKELFDYLELKQAQTEMWKQSYDAGVAIQAFIKKARPVGKSTATIEFHRHDVAKIKGDQIWMEIWAPMVLPKETTIGPIRLPKEIVEMLQVGWIINCELQKFKSGWQITEIGQTYPALRF